MIAHLDLDAFFAAVELHRRPQLRGRPVVVGGDPAGRGVVATASYAARRYGIRSAMSCAEARRRCPAAIFVRPDVAHYREWSGRVWRTVRHEASVVEVVGLDEGYVELPPGDSERAAIAIQRAVRERVRLSCSMGVAACKVVAKVASDRDKPGGITLVARGEEARFLAPLPVRALPGAGPRTEERLRRAGVETIGELAALDDRAVERALRGSHGQLLRQRARGVDPRPVRAEPAERLQVSTERTFPSDVSDRAELAARGREMAERLAATLGRRGVAGRTVTVKMRYPDFTTVTRGRTLPAAVDDPATIWSVADALLARAQIERPGALRLFGVSVSGLVADRQLSLFGAPRPLDGAGSR